MSATVTFSDEDCEHIRYGFTDTALALVIAKLDAHDAALDTAAVDGSGAHGVEDYCICEPGIRYDLCPVHARTVNCSWPGYDRDRTEW